jgi:hypothetical protein
MKRAGGSTQRVPVTPVQLLFGPLPSRCLQRGPGQCLSDPLVPDLMVQSCWVSHRNKVAVCVCVCVCVREGQRDRHSGLICAGSRGQGQRHSNPCPPSSLSLPRVDLGQRGIKRCWRTREGSTAEKRKTIHGIPSQFFSIICLSHIMFNFPRTMTLVP